MTTPGNADGPESWLQQSPEERALTLQASVAPDLYTANTFVPWNEIDRAIDGYSGAVAGLQELVDGDRFTRSEIADWLSTSQSLRVVRAIFAAPQPVGFTDGRQLPESVPTTSAGRARLAKLLMDLGLRRLLPSGARVVDIVRVGEIGLDARRRGFRRRNRANQSLSTLIQSAIDDATDVGPAKYQRLPYSKWPTSARGRVAAVIAADGEPVFAIRDVFQAQAGGRQRRDLVETYPTLQRDLDRESISLAVLLDGRGVQQAPHRALTTLIEQVAACMSMNEAQRGGLTQALIDAGSRAGLRRGAVRGLDAIIASALQQGSSISADLLPGSRDQALLAMGDFLSSNPNLALRLDPTTGTLEWENPEVVQRPRELGHVYAPKAAVETVAQLLGLADLTWLPSEDEVEGAFGSIADAVLPPRLLIAGVGSGVSVVDLELLRTVGRVNRTRDDGGRLALLVVPPGIASTVSLAQQRTLATSVVVVDGAALREAAQDRSPRRVLVDLVLQQADLTKANPFTVMGVAGRGVFYGRGQEDAMLQNTVRTNSAALIGGRRIGKTSLLQHARARLSDAGLNVQFADCQAVDSWGVFAQHAALHWQVQVDKEFSSGAVEELVAQLQSIGPGPLVVMMDEVDNLLRWDRESSSQGMNEPLFRTFRSLSQEGACQFVFSGERLIAQVLRDPSSPHWNFCRSIPVRQLAREDALNLFSTPIRALGVEIQDVESSLEQVWEATSGHPQLVQQLGENIVNSLNDRPSEFRRSLSSEEINEVATDADYYRHYVRTYWGQASPLEKLISALMAEGSRSVEEIMQALAEESVECSLDEVHSALRMLDLYGIIDESGSGLEWRATSFPVALAALGGSRLTVEDCVRQLR
jgi:hypothetical protein